MTFSPDTVVADAIKTDPGVIDRLVALDPTFDKLRNPVLRKVMARLVRFRDAAKIAGVPLDALMAAVNGDSPPPEMSRRREAGGDGGDGLPPDWLDGVDTKRAARFDARPLLSKGEEPLGPVLRAAAKVPKGAALVLDAPFDPVPLKLVLGRKGFVSHAERVGPEHWRVIFLRDAWLAAAAAEEPRRTDSGATVWQDAEETHIDVRGLEPPQPMRAIVDLLEQPETGDTIVVHHEREPVFLYPELAERGWSHSIIAGEPGEIRLRLTRGAPE